MTDTKALIDAATLLDEDEEPCTSKELIGDVSAERRAVWATRIEDSDLLNDNDQLVACVCQGGRGKLEHAVRIRNGVAEPLMMECKVSYEELPPSALVEYRFDESAPWRLSMVCLDYLLAFKKGKFKDWEKRLIQPTCMAEFRRMMNIGPVYKVYDHLMFPSPDDERDKFEVKDDNGKKVILPRPVAALRIWSVEKQAYEDVDPTLDGSPALSERDDYWKNMIAKLKENFKEEVEQLGY